jgi:adenylate cyclase class 2
MEIEYEVRRLNVSFDEIIQKIKSIGAKRVGVYHQKRYVYDFIPAQKGRWIRLRSNGKISTLTIKEIESVRIDGTKELEIEVSDFENTNEILMKLGYIPRNFQENFRIEYILDGVKFDLDKWPMIPAYLEIEGQSEKDILKVIKLLDWRIEDMSVQDVDKIYSEVYGINLDSKKKLEFNEKEIAFINKLSNL